MIHADLMHRPFNLVICCHNVALVVLQLIYCLRRGLLADLAPNNIFVVL